MKTAFKAEKQQGNESYHVRFNDDKIMGRFPDSELSSKF